MKITTTFSTLVTAAVLALFSFQGRAQTNIAPLAVASASNCSTGPCSTLNDLNLGSCGTQSMWISTGTPPSATPGVDWIQWDWTSTKTFNEIVIHHAQTAGRFLTGFTIQYWDGTGWVTTETISGLIPACINNVKFKNPLSAARWRITSFQMTSPGQQSNPNFREIEIIEAILGANNAAVAGLESPKAFCAGTQNIVARIANRGINRLNSVIVNWKYNGITQTPISFVGLLDTNGGTGPTDTAIFLGTRTFAAGIKQDLEVWTSMPNGVVDTITQDDSLITELQPSLSGTFTINPSGSGIGNYLSFNDAVADLNQYGVCGNVIFNVSDGVYSEQVDFNAIIGASATNQITFQPNSNNSGPILLTFPASTTSNYIVRFSGTNWVTFDGIDMLNNGAYGTNVSFESNASNNTIMNGMLTGNMTTNTTSNLYAVVYSNGTGYDGNRIINDSIIGGSMGIYFFGTTTIYNQGTVIQGNTIQDAYYMGMYLYGNENMSVTHNHVFGSRAYTSGYAIYDYYGGANNLVASNTITNNGFSSWPLYGILVGQQTSSGETTKSIVGNNNVHVGNPSSTSTHYGVYSTGNLYTDIVYNSVAQEGTSTTSRAGYVTGGGIGVRVLNNNFLHYGAGYGLYAFSTNAPTCDNNNTASAGPSIGYFNTNTADLAAWKAAGGGNNTINVDSIYTNLDSLRTCDTALFAKGTPVSGYAVDIDGDFRNPVSPNIGSDEYVASAELFTIGDTIEFCGGSELVIGTTMNDATFLWSTSETTPTITVTKEGNYSVIVDGPCATGMTDDVQVVDVNPVASFTVSSGDFLRGFNNTSEYGTKYLWDFGDGTTSTQLNPFHKYNSNGKYTVTLTVMNYCDTITTSQNIGIFVGMNEVVFNNNISIYPNPANEVININIGELKDQMIQMQIVDMKGQVHMNDLIKVTQGGVEQINVSSLSKGVYLIRLTTDNEVATRQVVVQ